MDYLLALAEPGQMNDANALFIEGMFRVALLICAIGASSWILEVILKFWKK